MVARGLAWGKGSAHCRGHGGNYSHKEIVLLSNLLSTTGWGEGGGAGQSPAGRGL